MEEKEQNLNKESQHLKKQVVEVAEAKSAAVKEVENLS